MKWFWTIGLVVFCGFSFGQIRVSESVQNLGDVFERSGKVTAKFNLENPYLEDTIRIVDIVTSCGCTAVLTQDTLILPRSSIVLDVTYDPTGRLGLFMKSVELTTRTGRDEYNKLYLKIAGNVVSESYSVENTNQELLEYAVAPIYFYPITAYDTSYLDFNYIMSFINDLTYEVDFYQFSTIGMEVEVPDFMDIEKIEYLLKFSQKKITREFTDRGFGLETIFFDEPVFKKASDLPVWASARIRLYSVNFDAPDLEESTIRVSSDEVVEQTKLLLDYQRFALPEIEEIVEQVNFESIEGKLFLQGGLELEGTILMPWKKSDKVRLKTAENLKKAIQKRIKETTGANKKVVHISFDSLGIHPDDKFYFALWDKSDKADKESFQYEIKPDEITPPLLPTYRQYYKDGVEMDTSAPAFKHFWENLIRNADANTDSLDLLIVSSQSIGGTQDEISKLQLATRLGEAICSDIEAMYVASTGKRLNVILKPIVQGPPLEVYKTHEEMIDLAQFESVRLIPLIHQKNDLKIGPSNPYKVNFDYFFKGIDPGAWGFQRFATYLAQAVQKNGYVALNIESSISQIPIEQTKSNLFLAYSRLLESEKRLYTAMAKKLIDENRIIFTSETALQQGPAYDGTIPILKYRQFHYIKIRPE